MSSRNRYLDARRSARWRRRSIARCRPRSRGSPPASATSPRIEARGLRRARDGAACSRDYFAVRDARATCSRPLPSTRDLVVLAAARLGKARLIDNLRVALLAPELAAPALAPCRASAQRTCSRTSAEGSSRRAASAAQHFGVGGRIAQRHRDVAQPALVADAADRRACDALLELLRASSANSSTRRGASRPCRTLKSGCAAARANLFHGHTSWQSSQP